jgi:integrase
VGEIRRADIVGLLDKLEHKKGLRQTVNRVRETLLALFAFAAEREWIEHNPVLGARRRKVEVKRRRRLTADEIRAVWLGLDRMPSLARSFVRVLLLTGCRREEARGMRWAELDFRAAVWTIPGDRTKNGHDHEVPLPGHIVNALKALPRSGEYVFSLNGKSPIGGMSDLKSRVERESGVTGWRFHDFRRTLRSGIAELGVVYEVAERVIGHTMPTLDQTYNLHLYLAEKRDALLRWERHVLAIVAQPANVLDAPGAEVSPPSSAGLIRV